MSRVRSLFSLVVVASLLTVAPAAASVDFGSDLSQAPDNATCIGGSAHSCTIASSAIPLHAATGGPVAPSDGVIVGWKARSGNQLETRSVRLHVVRGITGVAVGPTEVLETIGRVYNFAARIPVKAGDRLGIDYISLPMFAATPVINTGGAAGASFDLWEDTMLGETETRAPTTDDVPDAELLLQATLEPDADGDGWGDETQDKCKGAAGANEGCPPADPLLPAGPIPTKPPPNTKIFKFTKNGGIAIIGFKATPKGATFQCKMDKNSWKLCKSPQAYGGLDKGWHKFKVKAIGPTGVPDPTPAKRRFKVGR